jgi:hypothetical protein
VGTGNGDDDGDGGCISLHCIAWRFGLESSLGGAHLLAFSLAFTKRGVVVVCTYAYLHFFPPVVLYGGF